MKVLTMPGDGDFLVVQGSFPQATCPHQAILFQLMVTAVPCLLVVPAPVQQQATTQIGIHPCRSMLLDHCW